MMVASSADQGKSGMLVNLAHDLAAFVRNAVRNGSSLDDVERGAFDRLLKMGHAAIELFLAAQGDGDLGAELKTETGSVLHRSADTVERPLRTIFGEHTLRTYVYSSGAKRKIALRPIDARINLAEGKASYLLQEFTQLFCVEKAFGVGARQFEAVFGQRLSVDVLEDINRAMGDQADRFLESLPPLPRAAEGAILVASADGKGVPLVKQDAQQVPVFEEKERPGNRRMATLGCVYSVDPHVRSPEQVVATLFREPVASEPPDRPKARCKRYRAYFAEGEPGSADAVPSSYCTWRWLAEAVEARHKAHQPLVRLMDGQTTLWEASDACLAEWIEKRSAADKPPVVVDILDILHVSSYVWKAAKSFHAHKEHQEAFAQDRLLRILRGEVAGVVTGMRRMASQRGLTGEALKAVTITCNYFENNAARMRYDEYLRAGYPLATGVIEGACRHVIKDRMEQGGMRWTLAGAAAMLNVRAVCASSEWDKFGTWRQAEEAKRVHPHRVLVEEYAGFRA